MEEGAVEVDESGLFVGFGVVEDRLEPGLVRLVFDCDDRGRDFGDPLEEGKFDAGCLCFEIGAHTVDFFLGG